MNGVVFTVGNSLRGDDGAGPLLARMLETVPAAGWSVVDGGACPENHTHQVRALSPSRVLIVDAAEMELAPGEVRRIDTDCVARHALMTTHAIPLNYLIASLEESIPTIVFLGIQPRQTAFCESLSPEVREAVERLHRRLVQGGELEVECVGVPASG